MPVFLERFFLVLCAGAFLTFVLGNGMSLDVHYRIGLGIILVGLAYCVAHAVHQHNQPSNPPNNPARAVTSSEQPPALQAQERSDSMPNGGESDDRSVKIGDGNRFSNSPILTGDNAKVEIRTGPAKPFVLTPQARQKMAEVLSEYKDGQIALVCIGRGCQSMALVADALSAAGWRFAITQIGLYGSVGSPVDISSGVHVMDNSASPTAGNVLRRALRMVGVKFEDAPWQSFGNPGPGLCLVIGNPE